MGVPASLVIAVVMMTLACQVVLLPLPGVFSTDLFSYAFYGEVAGRLGGSPYVQVPDDFPTIPLYLLINPLWRDAPSVTVQCGSPCPPGGRALGRRCAGASVGLPPYRQRLPLGEPGSVVVGAAPPAARAEPFGLALYAWNPLVVFEFAANGHNDGLLILFLLVALGLAARGRAWAAVVALMLSVATKYTTVLLLAGAAVVGDAPPTRLAARRRRGGAGLAAGAALVVAYLPWWRGAATFGPIIYWVGTPLYAHYAPLSIAAWVRDRVWAAGRLDWDTAEQLIFAVERQVLRLGFLAYLAAETLRLRRAMDLPLACARIMLTFLLAVNTWVLPWYYACPVALVALGEPRSRTTWVALGLSATAPLSMYWAQTHLEGMDAAATCCIWPRSGRSWRGKSGGKCGRGARRRSTVRCARSAAAGGRQAAPPGDVEEVIQPPPAREWIPASVGLIGRADRVAPQQDAPRPLWHGFPEHGSSQRIEPPGAVFGQVVAGLLVEERSEDQRVRGVEVPARSRAPAAPHGSGNRPRKRTGGCGRVGSSAGWPRSGAPASRRTAPAPGAAAGG